MKIYFDGCSWTKGEELENRKEERFSKLVCDKLGAEEVNLARCGGSNDRIIRNLMIEYDITKYDMAVIQMTFPARTEYFYERETDRGWSAITGRTKYYTPEEYKKDENWVRVNPKSNYHKWLYKGKLTSLNQTVDRLSEKFLDHSTFWTDYYKNVMNEKYFDTKENIHMQTIRNHCKVNNVPLVLTSINKWTKQTFDLLLAKSSLPVHAYGHPTKEGHRMIADRIIGMVS